MAQWLSWLERRPVTAKVVGSSPIWVVFYVKAAYVYIKIGKGCFLLRGLAFASQIYYNRMSVRLTAAHGGRKIEYQKRQYTKK